MTMQHVTLTHQRAFHAHRREGVCDPIKCTNQGKKVQKSDWKQKTFVGSSVTLRPDDCGGRNLPVDFPPKEVTPTKITPNSPQYQLHYFLLFFETLLDPIINNSNQYAHKKGFKARFTRASLLSFIAVLLLMGLSPQPEYESYWRETLDRQTGQASIYGIPLISEIMTYDEFRAYKQILHWTTEDYEAGVTDVEQRLQDVFQNYWKPYQHLVVDEGIAPFKGHVAWRQHIKSKPHATGIKYFAMADDWGFIVDFFMFAAF